MGYPITAGSDMTSGGTMKYIPTLYAGKLLVKFYEASVLGECSNTDYEGMIRDQGDSVIIRTTPDITITKHTKGMTLSDESPDTTAITLNIDKGFYWSFRTDDPDYVQTDLNGFISAWTEDASYQLRNKIEQAVLEGVLPYVGHLGARQGAQSGDINLGTGGAVVQVTDATIVDTMVDCGTVLDESNVPDQDRFFLLPPRIVGLIKKSELKDASLAGDSTSIIRNGLVGMIDRFKVYQTGNLQYAADDLAWSCLFGTKHGITFASQLVKTKTIDNPTGFGMLHRGLHVFGYKVVKAEAIGTLYASLTASS